MSIHGEFTYFVKQLLDRGLLSNEKYVNPSHVYYTQKTLSGNLRNLKVMYLPMSDSWDK